jgi:hypothetical protein
VYSRLQVGGVDALQDDELSLSYHTKSLRLVSKKLDDPDQQANNEVMGAVGALMCHNVCYVSISKQWLMRTSISLKILKHGRNMEMHL